MNVCVCVCVRPTVYSKKSDYGMRTVFWVSIFLCQHLVGMEVTKLADLEVKVSHYCVTTRQK